jgi:rubrerythrin
MGKFDIERFVSLSKAVDLSDIDWAEAARVGLTDEEYRILRFLSDTESHTMLYLRDLLSGGAANEPEVMTFLSCWVYEEMHHGRAIDRMMKVCGRAPNGYQATSTRTSLRELLTGGLSRLAASASPHFRALHMAWGAVNECTAAATYQSLAQRTANRPLAMLVTKLARDERRHFSFYYHQAHQRLTDGGWAAQRFTAWSLKKFWAPPGSGVGEPASLDLMATHLFGDEGGVADIEAVDASIRRLPGLSGFDMVSRWVAEAKQRSPGRAVPAAPVSATTTTTNRASSDARASSVDVAA